MKIFKPAWVSHGHPKDEKIESCAIFSVDIHPDSSRFATGGQGEDSGRVVIWNMAPILSEAKEVDSRVPLMLCTLDNHLACVNAVRWSNSGRYLASGGDDKLIMIWTISKSQGSTIFGGKGKVNIEHWKCSHTLHGHTGDVLDIAWSPQDAWLATASVDNNIIIWNVERFPEVVTVLRGHTGLVKGVTWDPVGKYLSSQGDDRTLRIWRTADWQSEAVIEEPFKQCAGSTIMLRCAWSPDGQYIVSAHSLNNGGPTAQVIERDGWSCDKDYVGHRKAVTAVRFIPNLVKRKCGLGNHQKTRHLSVLAIGSRDHGVSVWLGGYPRPLVVIEDLFSSTVLDLAWSPNGLALLACSYDGTLACFLFTQSEIGLPISGSERNELYEKMYGTCVKLNTSLGPTGGGVGNLLIENCELLPEAELKTVSKRKDQEREKSVVKNEVTKEPPNGREEVKQVSIPVVDIDRSRESVPDEVLENGVLVRTSSSSCKSYPSPTRKQIETRTSDGRRRITPIYIPPTPDTCDGPAPFGSEAVLQTGDRKTSRFSSSSGIVIERHTDITVPPSVTQPTTIVSQPVNSGSVFVTSTPTKESSQPVSIKPSLKRTSDCQSTREPHTQLSKRQRLDDLESVVPKMCQVEKEEIVTVVKGDVGSINLPAMSIQSLHEFNVSPGTQLIIDNKAYNLPKGTIVCVKLRKNGIVIWEHVFGYKIVGASTSDKLVALALLDTSVYVLDIQKGTFKTPTLYLGALVTHIVLNNSGYLMVITSIGECYVWNVNTHTAILSKVSLAPLFSQCSMDKKHTDTTSIRIKYGTLSDEGIPMIALTTGKAFVYSQAFQCWSLVVDNNSGVVKNMSQQIKLANSSRVNLPLNTLHASCQNNSRALSIHNSEVSPLCTQSLLESQLNACITLGSPSEYRQWLLTSVHYYLQAGAEHRLRCLCEDLLGPSHGFASLSSTWDPNIMGLDKHSLLDEILTEVGKSIHCQRLYTEFRDQLTHLQAMASKRKPGSEPIKSTYTRSYSANIANIANSVATTGSYSPYIANMTNSVTTTGGYSPNITNLIDSVPTKTNITSGAYSTNISNTPNPMDISGVSSNTAKIPGTVGTTGELTGSTVHPGVLEDHMSTVSAPTGDGSRNDVDGSRNDVDGSRNDTSVMEVDSVPQVQNIADTTKIVGPLGDNVTKTIGPSVETIATSAKIIAPNAVIDGGFIAPNVTSIVEQGTSAVSEAMEIGESVTPDGAKSQTQITETSAVETNGKSIVEEKTAVRTNTGSKVDEETAVRTNTKIEGTTSVNTSVMAMDVSKDVVVSSEKDTTIGKPTETNAGVNKESKLVSLPAETANVNIVKEANRLGGENRQPAVETGIVQDKLDKPTSKEIEDASSAKSNEKLPSQSVSKPLEEVNIKSNCHITAISDGQNKTNPISTSVTGKPEDIRKPTDLNIPTRITSSGSSSKSSTTTPIESVPKTLPAQSEKVIPKETPQVTPNTLPFQQTSKVSQPLGPKPIQVSHTLGSKPAEQNFKVSQPIGSKLAEFQPLGSKTLEPLGSKAVQIIPFSSKPTQILPISSKPSQGSQTSDDN
ncbi:hypothetical protein M8J77_012801 [Diaphorina citri]|nr:hypothetical protein M8J77_012801 [Diaphorina citri]